jgi:hypothetical protein
MTQAIIVLSTLLARFRITSETHSARPVACGYLLKSEPPFRMRLRRRSDLQK